MIAIESSQGRRLKNLYPSDQAYAFHKRFGFVPEAQLEERTQRRQRHGLKAATDETLFRFLIQETAEGLAVTGLEGCEAATLAGAPDAGWSLTTAVGTFALKPIANTESTLFIAPTADEGGSSLWKYSLLALLFIALTVSVSMLLSPKGEVAPEVLPAPIQVTVIPEIQKPVKVPAPQVNVGQITDPRLQDTQVKRAINQNLGFLGMLGKKNLKGAIGGVPTSIKDASPGAGPGGKEGSGGEFLVGLGQGVRRATVGNTGVAGLGGIGTKGAGGGAGGYGNTMIGSGEGKALSRVAAVSGDMILEGGLDRAVIQATIAKYLSQVRACYEEQLQSNPGLSGQVTMAFSINGGGDVTSSKVDRSTLGNAKVENCISTRLMTWKFPKPVGGVTVKVNYPFLLRPVGT